MSQLYHITIAVSLEWCIATCIQQLIVTLYTQHCIINTLIIQCCTKRVVAMPKSNDAWIPEPYAVLYFCIASYATLLLMVHAYSYIYACIYIIYKIMHVRIQYVDASKQTLVYSLTSQVVMQMHQTKITNRIANTQLQI